MSDNTLTVPSENVTVPENPSGLQVQTLETDFLHSRERYTGPLSVNININLFAIK